MSKHRETDFIYKTHTRKQNNNYGFTLVEMSIVLVVIGLIVAGIVGGKSLVRAAELKSIINDFNKIKTALNLYNLQYDALPGDHRNAYDYFDGSGGNAVCGSNNIILLTTGCNGNGDGWIQSSAGVSEHARVFLHLALAKMIEGSYSGNYTDPNTFYKSEIKGASFHVFGQSTTDWLPNFG